MQTQWTNTPKQMTPKQQKSLRIGSIVLEVKASSAWSVKGKTYQITGINTDHGTPNSFTLDKERTIGANGILTNFELIRL